MAAIYCKKGEALTYVQADSKKQQVQSEKRSCFWMKLCCQKTAPEKLK